MYKRFAIAIDGPVGVGKGTLAVGLAKRLGAQYLYTGGMYRALTLICLLNKINIHDEKKVLDLLKKNSIEIKLTNLETRVFIEGEEVTDEIFSPQVTKNVPIVAAHPRVRKEMVHRQKKMVEGVNIIVEGRDSATDVVPHADLKIYLTADISVRAQRRLKQLRKRGLTTPFKEVLREVELRDKQDMERKVSPLRIVPDAFVIDTTNLTIDETVEKVMKKLREKGLI